MKAELRQHFRGLRSSFSDDQFQAWNRQIADHLASLSIPAGKSVGVYRALRAEADPSPLFSRALRLCFPKIISKGHMEFREVCPYREEAFEQGPHGLREPKIQQPAVSKDELDICIVPFLAFDASGLRLGKGGGYYDRFLENFKGQKIGLGFEWQFSSKALPAESFDQRLDQVVTEKGVRSFQQ